MPGSNGLTVRETLQAREKCPEAPGKRKFTSLMEAQIAARESSLTYRKPVVPYACPGCGLWHVTSKLRGSDVAKYRDDGIVQTTAMVQRERASATPPRQIERVDMSVIDAESSPVVPANAAAREKVLREYLVDKKTVTIPEISAILGDASRHVTGRLLKEQGWEGMRGRSEWYPVGSAPAIKRASQSKAKTRTKSAKSTRPANRGSAENVQQPIDLATRRAPSAGVAGLAEDLSWRTVPGSDQLAGMTLEQMTQTLAPFGVEVRIQIRGVASPS
jgi:hypothetical protein